MYTSSVAASSEGYVLGGVEGYDMSCRGLGELFGKNFVVESFYAEERAGEHG